MYTHAQLLAHIHYDPSTGHFTRLVKTNNNHSVGDRADIGRTGRYLYVSLMGHQIRAHRVAWFYMTGDWPKSVDHRDGDGRNNAWENLRPCTQGQNVCNAKVRSDNASGMKGIHHSPGRPLPWRGRVQKDGVVRAKHFSTLEEAQKFVAATRLELHGEFARH